MYDKYFKLIYMEHVKYRDFVRKPKDYMGKRVDIIGRSGVIASLFPPQLSDKECQTKKELYKEPEYDVSDKPVDPAKMSDKQDTFDNLKKDLGVEIVKGDMNQSQIEMLKLLGEHPLDINEFINETTGQLEKHKCTFCQTDKILIKMNNDGNNICLNCSPSIPAFESYKKLTEYSFKAKNLLVEIVNKQTDFSNEVNAIPKPVKKKKK